MGKRLRLRTSDLMETVSRLLGEARLGDVEVSLFHRGKQAYELHVECEGSGWHAKGVFGSPEEAERMGRRYLKGGLSWPGSAGTDAAVAYRVLNLAGDLIAEEGAGGDAAESGSSGSRG
jgi:hypothetical protein